MHLSRLGFFLVFLLVCTTANASTNDRETCETAIERLGLDVSGYRFEEGGLFGSGVHHFGQVTCTVGSDGQVREVHLGKFLLAEDGIVGPHLLRLAAAIKQSKSKLDDLAGQQRKEAIARAHEEYKSKKATAEEREIARLEELENFLEAALASVRQGQPSEEIITKLGVDFGYRDYQELDAGELLASAEETNALYGDTSSWTEYAQEQLDVVWKLAVETYSNPEQAAEDLKRNGLKLIATSKEGAKQIYKVVLEKTGEAYNLVAGANVCETIEVINSEAVSFLGGTVSGMAAAGKAAKPSRLLLYVERTYDEITIIKGVGFIQRSFTSGFMATKVVPAIPTSVTGTAAASAVVYLGATGVCYVTSPDAKEHLKAAQGFTFTALDAAKDKADSIVQYVSGVVGGPSSED